MPRKAKELSPLEVRRLTRPGRWSVGGVDGLTRAGHGHWREKLGAANLRWWQATRDGAGQFSHGLGS